MPDPPRLTRRTFTLSALGLGSAYVLTACEDGKASPPDRHEEPDAALLLAALAGEQAALALVRLTTHRNRRLRQVLAQPERFHTGHVRLLRGGVSGRVRTPRPRVPAATAAALDVVVAAEQRLVREHAHASMRAQSGQVARLLASLSAAAAQQERVLGAVDPGQLK